MYNLRNLELTDEARKEALRQKEALGSDSALAHAMQFISDTASKASDALTAAGANAAGFDALILRSERQLFVNAAKTAGLTKQQALIFIDTLKAAGIEIKSNEK